VAVEKINASRALFIKLGRQGKWENECLGNGTMRVSYRDIPHELCESGKWDVVVKHYRDKGQGPKEATRYANELKNFYQADAKTIWITFHARKLWWGFCSGCVTAGPVTQERIMVQVKSKASMVEVRKVESSAGLLMQYDRVFLVTHTFDGALSAKDLTRVEIIDAQRLATLVLDAGLCDWLLEKSS
jgi:hypothetical protein